MAENKFKFNASLLEFGEVNSGFMKIKLSVMSEEVANKTHFKKEVIDKRLSGLNYIPVVLEYKEEINDAGTHGGKIILDDDGIQFIETTKPYGVVIANTAKWEDIKQQNGETIPYITVEAFLWADRYDVSFINNGGINNQSMEVNILQSHYENTLDYLDIDDFEFSALTVLGKTVKPAFPNAKVISDYSENDFKVEYTEMLSALNIYLQKENKEVFCLDEKLELLSKYNLTVEELDFSLDNFSLEELESKLIEMSENPEGSKLIDFSATYRQKYDILRETLSSKNEVKRDNDGNRIEETWYWLQDFDDKFLYTEQNHWSDEEYNETIIRFEYAFNDTELTAEITSEPVEMIVTYLTKEEAEKVQADRASAETAYSELEEKFAQVENELKELFEFKEEKIKEEKLAVIEIFESKLTEEELSTINIDEFSASEIETKCYAMLGKKQLQFSATEKKPKKNYSTNFNEPKSTDSWMSVLADE